MAAHCRRLRAGERRAAGSARRLDQGGRSDRTRSPASGWCAGLLVVRRRELTDMGAEAGRPRTSVGTRVMVAGPCSRSPALSPTSRRWPTADPAGGGPALASALINQDADSSGSDNPRSRARRRKCLASNTNQPTSVTVAATLTQGAVPLLAAVHPQNRMLRLSRAGLSGTRSSGFAAPVPPSARDRGLYATAEGCGSESRGPGHGRAAPSAATCSGG